MAERIEYQGDTLPTGLPGFGDASISVLTLPGFNRVVAAQVFGPVVEANVTPPDPEPPAGSNPENPTNEVVTPGPAPGGSGASFNFCNECVPPQSDAFNNPLLFGQPRETTCTDCRGTKVGSYTWFETASDGAGNGVFLYEGTTGLQGVLDGETWSIKPTEFSVDGGTMSFIRGGGPLFVGRDGNDYKPHALEVCEGGETKTWYVLAYKPV